MTFPGWREWNAGIERIEIRGPFAVGTEFLMTQPGQAPLLTKIVEIKERALFVDETRLGDVVVLVAHRIAPVSKGRTRVTFAIQVSGPELRRVG